MMDDPFLQHFLAIRIGGRYQICQRLGSGSFAEVYMGKMTGPVRDTADPSLMTNDWLIQDAIC
jgi:hypothetical protein